MAKQRKTAYGIAEDGLSLKLAILTREGGQISLQALEQIELERSLYQHLDGVKIETNKASVEDINLDDFTVDSVPSFKVPPYETLFQSYSLNQGILAVNTFEEQIIKLPINAPDISQKQRTKLVREVVPKPEFKAGVWQSSVVTINEQSELWVHHGSNRLYDILNETAANNKLEFYYQLADANDIALANLFIQNQPTDSDETFMILYLGIDYRRALIFENNKWTFSLPIHISQHQSDINIVYSKLSLAMDEAHIADPKNLLVCGDFCNEDTVVFLRNQLPNTNVALWTLPSIELDAETVQVYDIDQIARFILPIALAWKALNMDQSSCIKSNFLPSSVIEGQKVFKIAWHGYVLLILLFLTSLYLTKTIFGLQFELEQGKYQNKELFTAYSSRKDQAAKMMTMARAIDIQTANIEVIKKLLEGKNTWSEILSRLNSSFQSHPTSWLTNLRKSPTGFQITGITTNRSHVVDFSNLFPKGSISKVFNRKIHSFSVWEFIIDYNYPEVNWLEMIEADAQQLKQYQAAKAEKLNKQGKQEGSGSSNTSSDKEGRSDFVSQNVGKVKQAINRKDTTIKVAKLIIDIPVPPQSLLAHNEEPDVKLYYDFVNAFNTGQKWLMRDLAVKFINNFPESPLNSYVRWYYCYRAWQNGEYEKPASWLEPVLAKSDAVKPYAMVLLGVNYRDNGETYKAETLWRRVLQEYPQHQVSKISRKLLDEKQ